MEYSKKAFIAAVFVFLFCWGKVNAQELVEKTLKWQELAFVSCYEVRIELYTSVNGWVEITNKKVEGQTSAICNLYPGKYRYNLTAYNMLGDKGKCSDWYYFELYPETDRKKDGKTEKFGIEVFYSPIAALPFSDYNKIYSTMPFHPLGFSASLSYLFAGNEIMAAGIEFSPSWNYLAATGKGENRETVILNCQAGIILRSNIGSKFSLDTRLGLGFSHIQSHYEYTKGNGIDYNTVNFSFLIGISLEVKLSDTLSCHYGIDYFHIITIDNPYLNFIVPKIGVGWKL